MRDKRYCIALNDFERRMVVNCLNEMRNDLIVNGTAENLEKFS